MKTPEQAALACASLWVVHTVDCATYGRSVCTGVLTPDGEPSAKSAVETAVLFEYAEALTVRLHERAVQMGLEPREVEAGREFVTAMPWERTGHDYPFACRVIGGKLAP